MAASDVREAGDDTPPAGASLAHRQVLLILSGLLLAMFLGALDQTVVSTSIRVIGDDLHDLSAQAWVTTAFLITSTIATPLYGKLSDEFGRRPFLLSSIAIFVAGSALCTFSTSMYELAAFRAVQGIGAGGLFSLSLATIGDIVSVRERARYQGYFVAVFGTSSVLGPLIGGALSGATSIAGISGWRWIFLINVPVGVAAFVVVFIVLRIPHNGVSRRIDYWGAAMLLVGVAPLLLAAEQGRTWGWGSVGTIACLAVGVGGIVGFVLVERAMGDAALIPLRLFGDRVFSLASAQSFVVGIGMFGAITVIPLYLQIVKGQSPTLSGLMTLPLVIGIMVSSTVSGQVISKTGHYRWFPIVGSALMVAALFMLWRLTADSSLVYAGAGMALLGLGLGANMQTLTLAMQNTVDAADNGVATSSATFFRQVGGTLGVAAFLSVLYSVLPGRLGTSFASAANDPAFVQAQQSHPGALHTLMSSAATNNTNLVTRLPDALADPWRQGFTSAMDVVFLVAAVIIAIDFVLAVMTPEKVLGGSSEKAAQPEQAPQPAETPQPAGRQWHDHGESPTPACPQAIRTMRPVASAGASR